MTLPTPTLFAWAVLTATPAPPGPALAPPTAVEAPVAARTRAPDASPRIPPSASDALLPSAPGAEPAPAAADPVQDPETIARAADAAVAALTSLGAEFTQEVVNPILERTTTGRGTLLYKAPDRFRIAWSDPAGDVVVNDGARVWIYLPSSQPGQVIRQPAAEAGVRNPLTYLRDLRDRFLARTAGRESVAGRPADHLAMTPKDESAPFAALDVWVDAATKLPRRVRTTTPDGVVTTYTFHGFQRNVGLADRLFTFAVPDGVEVFDP